MGRKTGVGQPAGKAGPTSGDATGEADSPQLAEGVPASSTPAHSSNWLALKAQLDGESDRRRREPISDAQWTAVQRRWRRKRQRRADAEQSDAGALAERAPASASQVVASAPAGGGCCVSLDCEYVGGGADGRTDLLARVSLVDADGRVLLDERVRPREKVTDWRTCVSGVRRGHLANAVDLDEARAAVRRLIDGNKVVGHAVHNDFRVLGVSHPPRLLRDTAKCELLRRAAADAGHARGRTPSLKLLAQVCLGLRVQTGEHDSVQDARTAMSLYQLYKKKWERALKAK